MSHRKKGKNQKFHDSVYRRSGWTCEMPECLCPDGRALNPELRWTDDVWAPSIDHVVLLSQGGRDHPSNMRAAHRRCNQQDAEFIRHGQYGQPAGLTARIGELFPELASLGVDNTES